MMLNGQSMLKTSIYNPLFKRSIQIFQSKTLTRGTINNIPTQELLEQLGFIKKISSGLFHLLPLGLRTLKKIENVIHSRMNNDANGLEVSLSLLSSKELWEKTNRWQNDELFKLKDGKKNEFCLTATCEEDSTQLMRGFINSYKDLPVLVYQIGKKYRDEIRPRGGLLRGKEFIMKDGYSFAKNEQESIEIFNKMNEVYFNIFKDLNVPVVSAIADSGEMGGSLSKEFHLLHPSGEDTIYTCSSCSNVSTMEKCESFPQSDKEGQYDKDVSVRYGLSRDHSTLICYYFPQNRELNWNLARKAIDYDIDMFLSDTPNDKIVKIYKDSVEDIIFAKVVRVMDIRLSSRANFPDFPLTQYLKNNFSQIDEVSIVNAESEEICGSCGEGHLVGAKSVELGHTFNLGTKYSKPLSVTYMDKENNKGQLVHMGCYGIGVSRIIGAMSEMNRDEKGLRWSRNMSPYLVSICHNTPVKKRIGTDPNLNIEIEKLKKELELKIPELSNEILYEFNENIGLGSRIFLSESLGIPINIIIGPKNWPKVEVEMRNIPKYYNDNDGKDEKSFLAKYENLKDKYKWEIVRGENGEIKKHIIPSIYLPKAVKILLDFL
ncbi:putative proline--tRNA ligase AIM10 NDAI_0A01800 [Naumovozyma dairenensis CBS 421]|uniref:proline--tRNA ligase n=1 Tax=Naumovozyma dairenensis (strain ATCC 10597 / BCRC 20456 / CBS 421 / NBRC 0211 / NRRL Y-12639) TaxID=1071378 RepID=G0W3F0_NAUDC|nr:hypothetical protein NDAI_0A01800 [Naumovozyma dairenensis CBS 421]CCD22338.1 hypothetical protein NDAI_0A01800 [Naumovozyma dairenensis CBS 421]